VRLFVAVDLPEAMRRGIADWLEAERGRLPRASWVRPENLHLTLAFLGDVESGQLSGLERALAGGVGRHAAFAAATGPLGGFPERGPLRVIWIGLEPEAELGELAASTRRALDAAGVAFDAKPFRAHVTLARARAPWPASWRERLAGSAPPRQCLRVDSVSLVESELGPGGARYRTLAEISLAEAA